MKRINILRAGGFVLLVIGSNAAQMTDADAPRLADPQATEPVTTHAMLAPGDSLVLNISSGIPALDSLRVDERWEQVADWAVYGTLLNSTLSASEVRDAMYDKVPLRLPGIEAAANLDYGPGRRVIQHDGSVWLFYAVDAPRAPTLARLADQARMDIGKIPERFSIFAIRSRLSAGAVTVRREEDISGARMFSEEFGYVQRTVGSLDDLSGWLRDADDLTHVRLTDGAVELGGRRLGEARTAGVTLEDISALYQAHQTLAAHNEQLDSSKTPVELAFSQVIDAFNVQVNRLNGSQYASLETQELDAAFAALEAKLDGDDLAENDVLADVKRMARRLSPGAFGTTRSGLDGYRSRLEGIRDEAESMIAREHRARLKNFTRENGWTLTSDPGFSLDPDVDSVALARGMRRLFDDPDAVIAEARAMARQYPPDVTGEHPTPVAVTAARYVTLAMIGGESEGLHEALRLVESSSLTADAVDSLAMYQASALLEFVETRAKLQCARYDGPLNGTRVGMILFYTDLMAKIWSIDYARSAPVDSVFGFLSALEVGERGEYEPVYWAEADSLSNTRLWFGPKKDAYSSQDDERELNFAHMATRVFSAGSDPSKPGVETRTAELNQRDIRWWDQHLTAVANYEPAYHEQNQIMKWSVVTGLLSKNARFSHLGDVRVDHSLRFDRWYSTNKELRYRRPVTLLPEHRWPAKTECLELLQSPRFNLAGHVSSLSGGVSLGGAKSLSEGTRILESVSPTLRRAGLDFSKSESGELVSLRSVKYRLPPSASTKLSSVEIKLATADDALGKVEETMLRGRGTLFHVDQLETQLRDLAGGGRTYSLFAGSDEVTSVAFRPGSGSLVLEVRDGVAMADRRMIDVIANRAAEDGSLAKAMALHPEAVPRSSYVVQDQARITIIMNASDGPRTLSLVTAEGNGSNKWITTAGADFAHLHPSKSVVKVSAERLEFAAGIEKLNATQWQRLSGRSGEQVSRVFGAEPPAGSTAAKIETGRADLGVINARIADDGIYLERPGNASANQAFNDLVLDQRVTTERIAYLIDASRRGTTEIPLAAEAAKPAEVLGDHIIAGDTRGMLRMLAKQGETGSLEQSFTGLREYVADRGFIAYEMGQTSRAADLFITADRATASPNELIYRAIANVKQGDVTAALDDIGAAFSRGAPSEDALAAADEVFRSTGHGGDIGNYGRWRRAGGGGAGNGGSKGGSGGFGNEGTGGTGKGGSGGFGDGTGGFAGEPRLVQEGYRQQFLLVVERRAKKVPVSLEYRRANVSRILEQDVIYVDEATLADRAVLLERDPDLAPGRFAADVVQDARLEMSAFQSNLPLGRPKKLVVGGRTYVRVDTRAATGAIIGAIGGAIYLVQSRCDDEESRRNQSCKAAS